jgi:aromatic-amino-acid transaminase
MFSYSGLSPEQVKRLQEEDSIYALSTGRICVAALNTKNIDKVAQAIAKVLTA